MVFEVPTGIVADVFSRRLSIILGRLLLAVAFVFEGSVPVFAAILLAEVVRVVGETFLSGASQAWLAGEVGEARVGAIFLRAAQLRRVAGPLAIATGRMGVYGRGWVRADRAAAGRVAESRPGVGVPADDRAFSRPSKTPTKFGHQRRPASLRLLSVDCAARIHPRRRLDPERS